jgi:hypothetical protein
VTADQNDQIRAALLKIADQPPTTPDGGCARASVTLEPRPLAWRRFL